MDKAFGVTRLTCVEDGENDELVRKLFELDIWLRLKSRRRVTWAKNEMDRGL